MIGWRFYDPGPTPLRELLEQLVSEQRRRPEGRGEPMPINVYEDGSAIVVEAAMPGVDPQAVDLSCGDGVLMIRGVAAIPERQYLHQELQSVEYLRQVALPGECRFEEADANVENGILTVRVPKLRPRAPDKIRIEVKRRSPSSTTIEAERGKGYSEVDEPGSS